MRNLKTYKAFSLIETIFAIVIFAIIVLSVPSMLSSVINSNYSMNIGKTFFHSLSLNNLILANYFDENNTLDDTDDKVLTSNDGDSELKCKRVGKQEINTDGRNCDGNTTSAIGPDSGEDNSDEYDDIDDYDKNVTTLNGFEYDVNISYISDDANYSDENVSFNLSYAPTDKKTNIKLITITTKSNDKIVSIFRYFSSNIGLTQVVKREF